MAGDDITSAPSSSSFSLPAPASTIRTKPSLSFDLSVSSINAPWLSFSARVWEYIDIYIRFTILCLAVGIISGVFFYYFSYISYNNETYFAIWPCAIPALAGFFYDLAELLVRYVRHGRGMPPKALIGCELTALLGSLAGLGIFIWQLFEYGGSFAWLTSSYLNTLVAVGSMNACIAIVRLVLFIRACIYRTRELKVGRPRVMYVPSTGEVVYLIPRPRRKVKELDMFGAMKETLGKESSSEVALARQETLELPPPLPPRPMARGPTELMRPPPEDYEPDEAELERRRRGDAQPQLILPGDMALKFATSIAGMAPGGSYAVEGKTLGRPSWADTDSLRSSDAPRRRSWG